jgi:hypothetical protein
VGQNVDEFVIICCWQQFSILEKGKGMLGFAAVEVESEKRFGVFGVE